MQSIHAHVVTVVLAGLCVGALAFALGGCGASPEQLRTRAAFDLNCPEAEVDIVGIDARTRGVRACGRQATYVESCARTGHLGDKQHCTWVLNSEPGAPSSVGGNGRKHAKVRRTDLQPPVAPASEAEQALSVFVDPEASVYATGDEKGEPVLDAFHDSLNDALRDAGYNVVSSPGEKHDLTLRISAERIAFNARPWAENVAIDVRGSGKTVTRVTRPSVNWLSAEGSDTVTRVAFAARSAVNAMTADPAMERFASSRQGATAVLPAFTPAAPSAQPAPLAAPAGPSSPLQ